MFLAFQRWFRIENRTIIKETTSILAIYDGFGFLQTIGGALIRGGALNWQITVPQGHVILAIGVKWPSRIN